MTGLQLIRKCKKVISQCGKGNVIGQSNWENRETVTVMACVSTNEQFVPHFVVMKDQR
jgi:hypothetical protein